MLIAAARIVPGVPAPRRAATQLPGLATAGTGVLAPGFVLVERDRIVRVSAGPPPRVPDLTLPDGVLVPGLIDLQLNGCAGVDLAAVDPGGWARVVRYLPGTGTTAFLPTLISAPVAGLAAAVRRARTLMRRLPRGARVLGVHLEGPFLAPARAGAHRRRWLVAPTERAVAGLLTAGVGVLRVVTLAPEAEGGLAAVAQLAKAGVVVSIGHSDATAGQVAAAAEAGARMVTHLFNAQSPFHHRDVGVPGQALTDPRLTSGLIADASHVAPAAVALAFAAAPGRICLVTDAVACAGMPPGRYLLGGDPVDLGPGAGAVPLRGDGTLAGSVLRMDQAVANAVAAGAGLAEAVAAASRVPADLIGRPDLGRLAPGALADLVWLGDDLRTRSAWVNGEQVHG